MWYTETHMSMCVSTGPYTKLCVLVYLGTPLCGHAPTDTPIGDMRACGHMRRRKGTELNAGTKDSRPIATATALEGTKIAPHIQGRPEAMGTGSQAAGTRKKTEVHTCISTQDLESREPVETPILTLGPPDLTGRSPRQPQTNPDLKVTGGHKLGKSRPSHLSPPEEASKGRELQPTQVGHRRKAWNTPLSHADKRKTNPGRETEKEQGALGPLLPRRGSV